MNDTSSIAVICTCGGDANISYDVIDSVIKQTLRPRQLIIVYDRTRSATAEAMQNRIKEAVPSLRLKCIEYDTDTTFDAARNIGLDYINGCEYIHFVNSDMQIPEDFYAKASRGLAGCLDCAAAVPASLKSANNIAAAIDLSGLIANPWLWLMRSKLEIAGMVLLRSSVVEKVGKFNSLLSLGADIDFVARVSNRGTWFYIPDCSVLCLHSRTEADMQSQFPDYHRQWALIYENLLDTYGARHRVPRKVYRSILAEAWYEAGRELLNHKRIEEARDCFMRSLSWRVINPSFKYVMKISRLRRETYISEDHSTHEK